MNKKMNKKMKKRIVRLTESEMIGLVEKIVKEVKRESLRESKRLETRRRVMAEANRPRRTIKEQRQEITGGNTPFQTLTAGGKEWNLMSPDTKGILKAIHGTLNVDVNKSNGEYVVIPTFRFQAGPKQAEYSGELLKKSKAATGQNDVGAWEWRTPLKNNRPSIDTSKSYFVSNGGEKISVDKFMSMLSNDKNAMAFVRDILEPLRGIY